ncbi:phosphatase PAP2 family protein [Trujillonella endophytica]|uniref:PAP2 superfamily protein n=1 Tax=Trujillonella endophytica TaxID=673521 RepID=A0A1H8VHT7_9ACTN|nr:phosphatase PAP2 family protein [Trujillella endophytica]SEP14850.1 PAP2 superfamily protein [Trujillella endophytica]
MTSGVVRRSPDTPDAGRRVPEHPPVVSIGRPTWWALGVALLVGAVLTVDLLVHGVTEHVDGWISDTVGGWGLRDTAAYTPLYWVTQIGGRGSVLIVLVGLIGWLAGRHRTLRPLLRVVVALVLLTVAVYALKYAIGRTAPGHGGDFLHHPDGQSYPSGHLANAVLLWGVARWQAVQYGMSPRIQRLFWGLAVIGPVLCTLAMVALDFHWLSDAVVGAAVGLLLLGVVHALDDLVLSRWLGARAGPRLS